MTETVQQIKTRAGKAARARHGGRLPSGYKISWRRYGRGGRWRGVGPNMWVETKDRAVVDREVWWMVAADENDAERRTEIAAIANGEKGTCRECGAVVRVRVPRAKFEPGDGTVRYPFKHGPRKNRCRGSYEPAKEWGFEQ